MSYTRRFALALGPAWPGIAADIRAQLIDDAGADVGSAQSGAVEIGGGNYIMTVSADAGWMGFVKFYSIVEASLIIPVAAMAPDDLGILIAHGDATWTTADVSTLNELNQVPTFHLNRGVSSIYELRKGLGYD